MLQRFHHLGIAFATCILLFASRSEPVFAQLGQPALDPKVERLAEALVKAKREAEGGALLASARDLVTADLVKAVSRQGDPFLNRGEYPQALSIYRLSQDIGDQIGDKLGIARALNSIGRVHCRQSNYAQARAYYQKSLTLFEALGHNAGIAGALGNIGLLYYRQNNCVQALEYLQKSLERCSRFFETHPELHAR